MDELNENARNLIRYCPGIVNTIADQLLSEVGILTLAKQGLAPGAVHFRTPEDLRTPMQTREG